MFADDLKTHYDAISGEKLNDHIFGHFDTFLRYGKGVDTITEFGVERGISTCAWLMSEPNKLTCYDIEIGQLEVRGLYEGFAKEKGIDFQLIEGDTHKIEIEPTDLLFIDTRHTIEHLLKELELHAGKVRKYILLHDTNSSMWPHFGRGCKRLEDILPDWGIKEHHLNCNGLTVLERIKEPIESIDKKGPAIMDTQGASILRKYAAGELTGRKALRQVSDAVRALPASHNRTIVLQDIGRKAAGQDTAPQLQTQVNVAIANLVGPVAPTQDVDSPEGQVLGSASESGTSTPPVTPAAGKGSKDENVD